MVTPCVLSWPLAASSIFLTSLSKYLSATNDMRRPLSWLDSDVTQMDGRVKTFRKVTRHALTRRQAVRLVVGWMIVIGRRHVMVR